MKGKKIFTHAEIVTHTGRFHGYVTVENEKITAIGEGMPDGLEGERIDLAGKTLIPGVIDAHIHFQDPGLTHREDFEHATASAAAGGITTCMSHPMNVPAIVDVPSYNANVAAYEGRSYVDYCVHGGGVQNNLDEVDALWRDTGAASIKMFMCFSTVDFPFVQDDALFSHLKIIAQNNGLAMLHCENEMLINRMERILKDQGKSDGMAFNASHPDYAEIEAIKRTIYFLEVTGARALVVHVSTAEGLRLIREARERRVAVYAETCPHFLTFIDEDMKKHGPFLKFTPPMRGEENRRALWDLLAKGYVDTMGSDHCPFTLEEKSKGLGNIWEAPNGIPGLQTMLPVLLDGVNQGRVSLEKVVELTSYNPARLYGLYPHKGILQPGADADLTVVDMDLVKPYAAEEILSKCPWSPYTGMNFKGWPVMTVVRGEIVFKEGKICGTCGHGRYIPREKP